ncbi:unnamed protein product [Sphenostylis stenocarpa]|uniref:Uncharacterized protein n=1 Tax=Sphenostylis stenocarpa TaxID=92480 RepID=A0AA86SJM9_9FABA|nr:unnamed protein product [Sphenostylis stenocarpa]
MGYDEWKKVLYSHNFMADVSFPSPNRYLPISPNDDKKPTTVLRTLTNQSANQ